MKRIITAILCGAFILSAFAGAAHAQPRGQYPGNYPQSYFEGQGSYVGGYGGGSGAMRTTLPGTMEHLYLGFTGVDEGLGFEGSFFTLGGLFPFYHDGFDGTWFSDDRLHVSEEGGFFGNFLIGRRQIIGETVHGFIFGYDYDRDKADVFGHEFHQLSGGLNITNDDYEFNFNGYLPISNTDYQIGSDTTPFVGNLMLIQPGYDIALSGLDGEFGFALPGMEHWAAKAFAGYYFYDPLERVSPVDGFGGARVRFEFSPHHRVSFNLQVNHDDTFDTTGFLNVNWHFFGGRHPAASSKTLQPSVRNAHIVRMHQEPIIATNPRTGLVYNVLHVNNLANPGGDGTFEAPLDNLTDAQTLSMVDDLIYVHGTGVTYSNTIQLKDRQALIGSGPGLVTVPTVEVGDFIVPSITDVNPVLGTPLGPSVFLANDNLVARNTFTGQSGIIGTGINNTSLVANTFLGNTLNGATIQNSTGVLLIQRNTFNGVGADGFNISNSTGTFNIFDNTFINNINGNGGHLLSTNGNAFVMGNRFGSSAQAPMPNGTGFRVTATAGTMNVLFSENTVVGDTVGATFQSFNVGTVLNTTVTNNNFSRTIIDALQFIASSGSTSNINIFDDSFSNNGTNGGIAIRVVATNPVAMGQASTANVTISNVNIDVGGGGAGPAAGILLSDVGNANFFANIDQLTVTDTAGLGSIGSGLAATFGNTNGVASTVTLANSMFSGVTNSAMSFSTGGLGAVQISSVVAMNNGTGITTTAASGVLDVHIDNSIFSNNTADGANVMLSGAGVHVLTVNNSAFNNNGDHGFELHATPAAPQFFGFFNNNVFLNNGGPQDFLAQVDVGGNPPLHAGTLLCLSFSQNIATSNYVLNNNADPTTMPPEMATFQFEDDGTNVPGFTAGGASGVTQVALGTCAAGAAPFRLLPP
ncbi:MAG: right-handed parallel beta-helix repeat-containing protein [Pirellulales bacterium]|nr:right-handed parallel beta-helix repeat-containing protein [Pirellulales bacterium]